MKPLACCLLLLGVSFTAAFQSQKKPPDIFTDPNKAGPDFLLQGEYEGEIAKVKYGLQIVALGNKKFDAFLLSGGLPGAGWDGKTRVKLTGVFSDAADSKAAADFKGNGWTGQAVAGEPTIFEGKSPKGEGFSLKQVVRKSSTEGAKPPLGALVLFDGMNVTEWNGGKLVEEKLLGPGATTKMKFKDFKLHVEFRLPFRPAARGQERANSGVYLQQRYEIQILDSFGLEPKKNDCAAIYEQTPPRVNMCYPPLSWQTYDIEFKAARYDADGKKTSNAVVTVLHNGVKVHDRAEIKGSTGHGKEEKDTPGAINLQNHGNPVYFRNIWLVEMKEERVPSLRLAQIEEEMNYFTRELIESGQSKDPAILNRHEELWDEACERYFKRLDSLKDEMPPGLRQLVDNYYLHDAVIRGMGQRGRSFLIVIQLNTPPESLLTFVYDLVEDPVIDKAALVPAYCSTGPIVDWQYDEIERVEGEPPTWRQSVLFSNGWEVRLHFRDVRVEETQALLPSPRNGSFVALPSAASHHA